MTKNLERAPAALLLVALSMTTARPAVGQPRAAETAPTFYRDVLPILQQECQACHREGGSNLGGMIAPMALLDYDQVRPWAKAIARNARERTMPPWHASPEQAGVFTNERTLTEAEIETLVSWATTGAVAGDAGDAPPAIEWPSHQGWSMGEPDLVISMPEPFLVGDEVEDLYIDFPLVITDEMLSEPRWIQSVEFRPGSGAVHHIVGYPVGSMVPGGGATVYPEGVGVLLEPGTKGRWSMHYHKEPGPGTAVWDQSTVAIHFHPREAEITHLLRTGCLCNFDFLIPAGDPHYEVHSELTFERDALLLDILPHMHLRGKAARFEAVYPDGTSKVLLDVPEYDFNWQTTYRFREPEFIPAGARIVSTSVFDNSAGNPSNPDPTVDVGYGEPTTAEMIKSPVRYIHAVDEEDVEAELAGHRAKKGRKKSQKLGGKPPPSDKKPTLGRAASDRAKGVG